MSLSLDDFEDVKQEEKQSAAATAAAEAASSPASAAGLGIKPPSSETHASGLNIPGLINQAWETVKPALNPVHYNAGGPQDYTNIDVPTTVAHGVGLSAVGLGAAGRIKRSLSGEAAANSQYAEQNKLARERFEYQKQRDALADAENMRQVESKVVAQASGKPVPEARIEPTFAPESTPTPAVPQSAPAPVATKPAAIPPLPQPTVQPPVDYSLNPTAGYGQQNLNAPTGAPSPLPPAAPPVEAAPAPVEPKPMSEIERVRLEKAQFELEAAKAKEARAAELHANRLAADAKRAESKVQQSQGKAYNNQDNTMLASDQRVKVEKAAEAQGAKKLPKTPPVASVPAPATPNLNPPSQAPATVAEAQAAGPAIGTAQEVAKASTPAPTEVKGAKAPKWPGGAEGSAVQLFGGTKKNFTPESQAAVELFKEHVGGPLTMPATGGSINQIEQASKFYEKYTGQPLPRSPEGKLTRIPEEQIQKLHTGIRTELEGAVSAGKLGTLGKGAMAAAALLGLTGAVQAAQKGDFGPLRQAGFDIGGPVALGKLGLTALSRAGGAGFSAATYSGNLNEGEQEELARRRHDYMMKESQKLGSPLRSVPPPR